MLSRQPETRWKRVMRRGVTATITTFWQIGFRVAGMLSRPQARLWCTNGRQTIWVIAPHPDDETVGCAGAILRHRRAGDDVYLLVITDGRGSRAFGLAPAEMASRRFEEAQAAASILHVNQLIWFGLPEYKWEADQLLGELAAAWQAYPPPDVLYAPSRVDFHPEHLKAASAVALALRDKPDVTVRVYPIQVPLTAVLTNLICDVSPEAEGIQSALASYTTQYYNIESALRQRRYAAALYGIGRLVESYWEMPARQYINLHLAERADDPRRPFRGLRSWPFSDPFAYWQQRRERRRLARKI